MSFKKGDRVRCVDPDGGCLTMGRVYIVGEYIDDYAASVRVEGIDKYFFEWRFVLVDEPKVTPSGILPADAEARKALPLFSGLIKYFPDALSAVAELSRIGNEQHNPGKPLHWDRSKSGDELDALTRHLFEAGTVDVDGVRHSAKVAWRALANLQKEIEAAREIDRLAAISETTVEVSL